MADAMRTPSNPGEERHVSGPSEGETQEVPVESPPSRVPGQGTGRRGSGRPVSAWPTGGAVATDPGVGAPVVRGPAIRLGTLGLLTLILGAWGGIIAYVGPTFGYGVNGSGSWHWSLQHTLLYLVPGAAGVMAGAAMVLTAPRAYVGRGRTIVATAGLLAVLAGAWFVVGPIAWPIFHSGSPVFLPASPKRNFANQVGYNLGPGLLLVFFGAMAVGLTGLYRKVRARGRPMSGGTGEAPEAASARGFS